MLFTREALLFTIERYCYGESDCDDDTDPMLLTTAAHAETKTTIQPLDPDKPDSNLDDEDSSQWTTRTMTTPT